MKHGYGEILNDTNYVLVRGAYIQDMLEGYATLYNEDSTAFKPSPFDKCHFDLELRDHRWVSFEGEFRNGRKFGMGMITFSNHNVFRGQFSEDRANGEGEYTYTDGRKVEGNWV
jgi:hypothetical protein